MLIKRSLHGAGHRPASALCEDNRAGGIEFSATLLSQIAKAALPSQRKGQVAT
jgi:hypothetical protein